MGARAVRLAIGVGRDVDNRYLQKFIGHPEIQPMQANNPEALVEHIKTMSTTVLEQASAPKRNETVVESVELPPLPKEAVSDTTW